MIVYLFRHASAGDPIANPAKDEKRPLDEDGENQSHDVGRVLAALKIEVDVIISSPLTRALQSAELAAKEFRHKDKIVTDDAMRPEAGYDQFQDLLTRYGKNKAIMVVGHNPSISVFANHLLSGSNRRDCAEFKKGALMKVEVKSGRGKLNWMLTPKLARVLQTASPKSSRPKTAKK